MLYGIIEHELWRQIWGWFLALLSTRHPLGQKSAVVKNSLLKSCDPSCGSFTYWVTLNNLLLPSIPQLAHYINWDNKHNYWKDIEKEMGWENECFTSVKAYSTVSAQWQAHNRCSRWINGSSSSSFPIATPMPCNFAGAPSKEEEYISSLLNFGWNPVTYFGP